MKGNVKESVGRPIRLERRADGSLLADVEGRLQPVRVQRCFPWSQPESFLSLRDADGVEVALIESGDELDEASRRALDTALVEAGFVLEIEAIEEVDEEIEIRTWRVRTRQGPRRFQTRLDDWPWTVPGGGIVIRDVAGDLYHVASPESLDALSRRWLWAFVD